MYIYGGYDADGFCSNEIFSWDFSSRQWDKMEPSKTQTREFALERFHHSAIAIESVMIVFGGKDSLGHVCDNGLLEYHFETRTWAAIQTAGMAPTPRWGHCAALLGYA